MAQNPRNEQERAAYYQNADGTTAPIRRPETPEIVGPAYQAGYQRPEYQPQYTSYQQPYPQQQQPYQQQPAYQPRKEYHHDNPSPFQPDYKGAEPIETKEEKKQNMIIRILRVLFIIFQSIAMIAGVALVIAGSLWYRAIRKRQLHNSFFGTLPMLAIGAGVALTLLSCIGLVAAITRGRSGAIVYSLLVVCLIGSQAYMLYRTNRLDKQVMGFLSAKWEELSGKQRRIIQDWRKCCGFGAPDDRSSKPCPLGTRTGCALPIHATMKKWSGSIIKGLSISMCVEIILIGLVLLISFAKFHY